MASAPLSRRDRIALERRFAATALAHFGFDRPQYSLLTLSHAARFRVRGADQYLLRLNNPDWHSAPLIASELVWLTHLHQHASLIVPQPLHFADHSGVLELTLPDTSERRVASLFRWLPGHRRLKNVTAWHAERIGKVLARLHVAAMAFEPPAGFIRHDFHVEIFPYLAQHLRTVESRLLDAYEQRLCQDAFAQVSTYLEQLGRPPSRYGLIHGDTNLSNFLYQHNDVALIDFEVCCFGYYLYDVARTLNELATYAQSARLISAFYTGYQELLPSLPAWTDTALRMFRLINHLEIVRWIITTPPEYHQPEMVPMLRQTMQTIRYITAA